MPLLINGLELSNAVTRDRLPRVADADDGSRHVLYMENGSPLPQSMLAADWLAQRGPLPTEPTQAESDAAVLAIAQAAAQAATDAAQLRQQILTLAQSAVGVRVDNLTAGQVRALVAILLRKADALNNDLTIRPLADWANR
jgi:hypothetical protein